MAERVKKYLPKDFKPLLEAIQAVTGQLEKGAGEKSMTDAVKNLKRIMDSKKFDDCCRRAHVIKLLDVGKVDRE
jgi:hypothetical protein